MSFTLTPQQEAILAAVVSGSSTIVTARAGCGKTSTLALCAAHLPPETRGAYLAFNVKVKKEAEARFPANWQCLTLNGLGHRAWQAGRPRLDLQPKKDRATVDEYLSIARLSATWDEKRELAALLNQARLLGLVPQGMPASGFLDDTEEGWRTVFAAAEVDWKEETLAISRGVLRNSIAVAQRGLIDFVDQIYMPTCFGGSWPRFDILFGDEAQDFSPANLKMLTLTSARQKVFVGDPKQAIYAFRGAMADSMEHLETTMNGETEWKHLFLTKTFRCGKAIVARQRPFCPDFEAGEGNPDGEVLNWTTPRTTQDGEKPPHWEPHEVPNGSAILCRNNAPLIKAALRFLRAGRKVAVLGRDFGESLRRDIRKATRDGAPTLPIFSAHEKIKAFYEQKLTGGTKPPTEEELAAVQDRVEAIVALSDSCSTLGALFTRIDTIFSDEKAPVTFSTGHKAKGLEWDFVLHLNPWLIPAKWARGPSALQEANLRYVIETRPKTTLVLADLDDLKA